MVARDTSNNIVLVSKLEVDSSEVEQQMRQLVSGDLRLSQTFSKISVNFEIEPLFTLRDFTTRPANIEV